MNLRQSRAVSSAFLVPAAASWGLGTVLSKSALDHLPPLTLLVVQLIMSVASLWLVLAFHRSPFPPNHQLLPLSLLGWLNPGLSYTLSLLGLALTTASASALLWATEPLLIAALAWLILRERPGRPFLTLMTVAAIGVALVVGVDVGQPGALAGNGLILSGVMCCALYTVLAGQLGLGINPLLAVTLQQSLALVWALLIWPVELAGSGLAALGAVPAPSWGMAALSGLVYYGLAFWFYVSGLQRTSASVAGLYINLVPVFALAGAHGLLGEMLKPVQWLGSGIVLLAVMAFSRLPRLTRWVHRPGEP